MIALGLAHPVAAAALWSATTLGVHERDVRIRYAAGTDVETVLVAPASVQRTPPREEWTPVMPPDSLRRIAISWPVHAEAEGGSVGADPINLAFVGDSETVTHALRSAGWDLAARKSMRSDVTTVIRASANRGYAHQPVSTLLLGGKAPDLVFERVTNSIAMRHHIRLWRWSGAVNGAPLWLASASHDVGIEFLRDRRHFTHRIDPAIDGERAKVVNDLWAFDCIAQQSGVSRSPPSALRVNDGRDPVSTDGELLVLRLRAACGGAAATAPTVRR
jgi:hypothetical protein